MRTERVGERLRASVALVFVTIAMALAMCLPGTALAAETTATNVPDANGAISGFLGTSETVEGWTAPDGRQLTAYYLNVGQGDSELVVLPDGETMLIDASTADQGAGIVDYLSALGVTRIDHMVVTHGDADHVGGMSKVLDSVQTGDIWMPSASVSDTKTCMGFLQDVDAHGMQINDAVAGSVIASGDGFSVEVLSPSANATADSTNDASAEVLVRYGVTSFLFTGDASTQETDACEPDHVDVLKVGHHGSKTSTDPTLARQLTPEISVIECGAGNQYGFPTEQALDALRAVGSAVYCTADNGTVQVTTDGATIAASCDVAGTVEAGADTKTSVPTLASEASAIASANAAAAPAAADAAAAPAAPATTEQVAAAPAAEPEATAPAAEPVAVPADDAGDDETVYITDSGKKYHAAGCRYLKHSSHPISKSQAQAEGYQPCSVCNP